MRAFQENVAVPGIIAIQRPWPVAGSTTRCTWMWAESLPFSYRSSMRPMLWPTLRTAGAGRGASGPLTIEVVTGFGVPSARTRPMLMPATFSSYEPGSLASMMATTSPTIIAVVSGEGALPVHWRIEIFARVTVSEYVAMAVFMWATAQASASS